MTKVALTTPTLPVKVQLLMVKVPPPVLAKPANVASLVIAPQKAVCEAGAVAGLTVMGGVAIPRAVTLTTKLPAVGVVVVPVLTVTPA